MPKIISNTTWAHSPSRYFWTSSYGIVRVREKELCPPGAMYINVEFTAMYSPVELRIPK
ncbi:MAG: hypothetical protein ACUVUS_10535 [Thermoproteota archaeon]